MLYSYQCIIFRVLLGASDWYYNGDSDLLARKCQRSARAIQTGSVFLITHEWSVLDRLCSQY